MICTLATMGATAVGAGASAVGLLRHQAGTLRRAFDEDENRPHSTFAEAIAAPRHRDDDDSAALAIIGDSWLCGVDVDAEQAPPTLIGRGLARMLGTTVRVQTTARPSALSDDLHRQVDEGLRVDAGHAPPTLAARALAPIVGTAARVQATGRRSAPSDDLHRQVDEGLRSAGLPRQLSEPWNDSRRFAIISIGTGDIIRPIQP